MPSFVLRALRYRNYRLFFAGQGVSLIGSWLSMVATSWLVYRLAPRDEAAVVLGVAGFAMQVPSLFLGPLGGVLADRWDTRKLLIATQAGSMLQSGMLAGLAFSGLVTIPQVIALSVLQGVINSFDMPARQTFVVQIIEKPEDLPNAIAINSTMFNGARLLGPAIAGFIIAKAGTSYCFLIDALTFLAVIGALYLIQAPPRPKKSAPASVYSELGQGFRYAMGFPPVRGAILLCAAISMAYMSVQVLVPIFAGRLSSGLPAAPGGEDQGAKIFGFLTAAAGLGALSAGIYLAVRTSVRGLGRVIGFSLLVLGSGILGLGLADGLALALAGMFAMGFGMLLTFASINTVLQTIIEDDKRGRVMSFFFMAFMGTAPFASLLGGYIADHFGPTRAALFSGGVCLLAWLFYMTALPRMRKVVGPIYESRGLKPAEPPIPG